MDVPPTLHQCSPDARYAWFWPVMMFWKAIFIVIADQILSTAYVGWCKWSIPKVTLVFSCDLDRQGILQFGKDEYRWIRIGIL